MIKFLREGNNTPTPTDSRVVSWPKEKKVFVLMTGLFLNFNVTLSSSLPSGGIEALMHHFGVQGQDQSALPVAIFLVGYIFGPSVFGPFSELYGRWLALISSFAIYTVFTLACAVAPNWVGFLFFRFACGIGASGPQTVLSGTFSDMYSSILYRGRAIALLAFVSTIAPLFGPLIAGFTAERDWTWMFWISLGMALASWPFLILLPETYEPIIRNKLKRKNSSSTTSSTVTNIPLRQRLKLPLMIICRPFRMLLEPMVFFTDLFMVIEYTIFFLYFEAYPLIFSGIYHMHPGHASLMLLPVAIGVILAQLIYLWYDGYRDRASQRGKVWASKEEYRRLPLVCLGGPLNALSQIWLAWSARSSTHWSVPMLSGILHGLGDDLIFVGLNTYITDSYGVYSASAIATAVFTRYIGAAILLPLVSGRMYTNLGVSWSVTILGLLCFAVSVIPFVFIRFGPQLRRKSKFCQKLKSIYSKGETITVDIDAENT